MLDMFSSIDDNVSNIIIMLSTFICILGITEPKSLGKTKYSISSQVDELEFYAFVRAL